MFAILQTGGKQYRVAPGTELSIERIEAVEGSELSLDNVLLYANGEDVRIGTPFVSDVTVTAQVVDHLKGPKIIIFKKIRRQGKQLKKGHRQQLTRLKITDISA